VPTPERKIAQGYFPESLRVVRFGPLTISLVLPILTRSPSEGYISKLKVCHKILAGFSEYCSLLHFPPSFTVVFS